ncbi:hypothetical protein HAX54_030980 [Datura stramonium]|uniref:Uncharacterized protein n=1 Tax=Datura stramonium TaxID=4076 RepID=A0ABS8VAW2_DATST|nr:hypothetical protein [Datura stramonium]
MSIDERVQEKGIMMPSVAQNWTWFSLSALGDITRRCSMIQSFYLSLLSFMNCGKSQGDGSDPLNIGRKKLKLHKLVELLSDAEDLCLWIQEEEAVLHQIIQKLSISSSHRRNYQTRLTEVKNIGLQWADAKKVSTDGGALGLDKVFELITDEPDDCLPINVMNGIILIASSYPHCQDLHHPACCCMEGREGFCINVNNGEEGYRWQTRGTSGAFSTWHRESRRKSEKQMGRVDVAADVSRSSSNIEQLFWKNRKPYRRVAPDHDLGLELRSRSGPGSVHVWILGVVGVDCRSPELGLDHGQVEDQRWSRS